MIKEIEIGSLWANSEGHKTMILAYDSISGQYFLYDYILNHTKFVSINAFEDGAYKKWNDYISSEQSEFEKEKSRMQIKMWEAFTCAPGRLIEDGQPSAMFIVKKDNEDLLFAYQEFVMKEEHVKVGKSIFESFSNAVCFSAKKFTDEQSVDHIVWRTYPEMGLSYNCISGQRTLIAYARLAAFSKEKQVSVPYENKFHSEAKEAA